MRSLLGSVVLRPTAAAAAAAALVAVSRHAVVRRPRTLSQTLLNHRLLPHAVLRRRVPPHVTDTDSRAVLGLAAVHTSGAGTEDPGRVCRARERSPGTHVAHTLLRSSGTQNASRSMLRERLHWRVSELDGAAAWGQLGRHGRRGAIVPTSVSLRERRALRILQHAVVVDLWVLLLLLLRRRRRGSAGSVVVAAVAVADVGGV